MKSKYCIVLRITVLLLSIFSLTIPLSLAETNDSPNIMVIHSYDLSYQWTNKQDEGFRRVFLSEYPKANIYTEVLDAKRFDKDFILEDQMESFINKYKNLDIDIIVATDDMGLEFAVESRKALDIQVPIAFSGVLENKVEELVGNYENVTGVFEIRGFTRMIELMRILQPKSNRIVIINDTSSSSKQLVSKVLNGFRELKLLDSYEIEYWEEKSYEDILRDVKELDMNTAVYLISYHKSFDGIIKTGQIFCNEISEVSSAPMYSLGELYFGSGLTGGEFLSGHLQGEALANIALKIINGKDVNNIPYSKKSTSYIGVDENMTRKYGIDNINLPKDTVIINEKISFYEKYRILVLSVAAIFIVLIIFIFTLIIQRQTINRTNLALKDQKKKLQLLYDQVLTSEEELKAQNEELIFYQEKLQFEINHDYLTGLQNRSYHEEIMCRSLAADVNQQKQYIFTFIDLDNFKYINNSMGHHTGDIILQEIAKRFKSLGKKYSIARVGGDEFVLVYEFKEISTDHAVEHITNLVEKIFILPVRIGEEMIKVNASMGCSFYPDDALTYDELIIYADFAMYEAKRKQNGIMVRFNTEIEKSSERVYKLAKGIRKGIDDKEFYLVYQPIISAEDLNVEGLEALLRWESKEFGAVSPVEFIHAAEVGGHMITLGDEVFDIALSFLSRKSQEIYDIERLSINISVIQLHEEGFVARLLEKLKKFDVDPKRIQLEIIESVMIHSYDIVCEKLQALKEQGIAIALDDFGTGYSSLAHLNTLPIDTLKIDKRFIDSIADDEQANHIVETISLLARSLNLESVAEGVETESQAKYLRESNIDAIQGYLYSKPLIEKEILEFIYSNRSTSDNIK